MLLVASPVYLARRGNPRRPADLNRHTCLVMSGARTPTSWPLYVRGRRMLVEVEPHVAVNSHLVLRALAIAGHGIARLPERRVEGPGRAGQLRVVLEKLASPPLPWHAVYPSARHVSVKLRILLEVLEERLRTIDVQL